MAPPCPHRQSWRRAWRAWAAALAGHAIAFPSLDMGTLMTLLGGLLGLGGMRTAEKLQGIK